MLILASASPRRAELIDRLGLEVVIRPRPVDEAALAEGRDPQAAVIAVAEAKVDALTDHDLAEFPEGTTVVGADTVVVHEGRAIGKPTDRAHAQALLTEFSGSMISVVTGLAVRTAGWPCTSVTCRTDVWMRLIDPAVIDTYVATGTADDKAGGLALQGEAGPFIERVDGCWTNVVGLPLCELAHLLALPPEPVHCMNRSDHPCTRWRTGEIGR